MMITEERLYVFEKLAKKEDILSKEFALELITEVRRLRLVVEAARQYFDPATDGKRKCQSAAEFHKALAKFDEVRPES